MNCGLREFPLNALEKLLKIKCWWNHADVFCLYMFVCSGNAINVLGLWGLGEAGDCLDLRSSGQQWQLHMFEGFDFRLLHFVLVHLKKNIVCFSTTFEFGEGWPGQSCKGVTQSSLGIYLTGCLSSTVAPVSSGRPLKSLKWTTLRLCFLSSWRLETTADKNGKWFQEFKGTTWHRSFCMFLVRGVEGPRSYKAARMVPPGYRQRMQLLSCRKYRRF